VLASATLSYQILITAFFSRHAGIIIFAFAAISTLAMLGLTRGSDGGFMASLIATHPNEWPWSSSPRMWFAITGVGADDRLPVRARLGPLSEDYCWWPFGS